MQPRVAACLLNAGITGLLPPDFLIMATKHHGPKFNFAPWHWVHLTLYSLVRIYKAFTKYEFIKVSKQYIILFHCPVQIQSILQLLWSCKYDLSNKRVKSQTVMYSRLGRTRSMHQRLCIQQALAAYVTVAKIKLVCKVKYPKYWRKRFSQNYIYNC